MITYSAAIPVWEKWQEWEVKVGERALLEEECMQRDACTRMHACSPLKMSVRDELKREKPRDAPSHAEKRA